MSQSDLIGCDDFVLRYDDAGGFDAGEVAENDETQQVLRWDEPEALRLDFGEYCRRTGCDGSVASREARFCAYYGGNSDAHNRREKRTLSAAEKAAKQAKRAAWQKYRARRRQPIQWNQKNRQRRARSFGMINHCVGYLVGVLRRGGVGALVPLIFAVGEHGKRQRERFHLNAVERAWRACFRTKDVPCPKVQRKIREAVAKSLLTQGVKFFQQHGIFKEGGNSSDPFTRGNCLGKNKSKTIKIPPGRIVKESAENEAGETRKRGRWRRAVAWKAARGAIECAQAHWPGMSVRFSFKHVYAWLNRNGTRGYDIGELVKLYRDEHETHGLLLKWHGRGSDAGEIFEPSGLMSDLQREVEASLEPFWSMMNDHGTARRKKRRQQIRAQYGHVFGGSNPFAAARNVEKTTNDEDEF